MRIFKVLLAVFIFIYMDLAPPEGWGEITAVGLMPKPGSQVSLSANFNLAHLKGMIIDANDPFKFDFIIHQGDEHLTYKQKKYEYTKLIKYFLAALAVPDSDQWVNLSPYEKNRIIPHNFGKTEMGQDLLAQDYLLKQLSSSLTNPKTSLGKKFWDMVSGRIYREFGTRNIPVNTFNKVWIVPDKAVIYEKGNMVYVISSHLKVMTEADYLAMKMHRQNQAINEKNKAVNISNELMRRIIIPAIEQEANKGRNFAPLRQVLSGMLLATWYKHALKEAILTKLYADKSKLKGIDQPSQTNEEIFRQYLKAYRKGVYNFIKEDTDPLTQEIVPRKYFSGGFRNAFKSAITVGSKQKANADFTNNKIDLWKVRVKLNSSAATGAIILNLLAAGIAPSGRAAIIKPVAPPSPTGQVTLAWNPSTNPSVAGYHLYYGGISSGVYTNEIDVKTATQITVSNLTFGVTYYFAATSYSTAGVESPLCPEVSEPMSWPLAANTVNWTPNLPQQTYKLTGIPAGSVVTASSSSPLISNIKVTNGILTYDIPANQSGTGTINIFLNGSIVPFQNLPVTINPVFDISDLKRVGTAWVMGLSSPNVSPYTTNIAGIYASTNLTSWHLIKTAELIGTNIFEISYPETEILRQEYFTAAPTNTVPNQAQLSFTAKGGIDFSQSNLDMQIRRDGNGVVLPVSRQNLDKIHIEGLVPVILSIRPAGSKPSDTLSF